MNSLITVFFTCAVLCVSSVVAQSADPRVGRFPDNQTDQYRIVSRTSFPPLPPCETYWRGCTCQPVSRVSCRPSNSMGLDTCLSQIVKGVLEIPVALLDIPVRTAKRLVTNPRPFYAKSKTTSASANHRSTSSNIEMPRTSPWRESSLSNPAGFRTRSLSHAAPFENSFVRRNPQNHASSTPSHSTILGAPLPSLPERDSRLIAGIEAYRDFRYEDSLRILEDYLASASERHPIFLEALIYASASAWMLDDDEMAASLFRKARVLNPDFQIDEDEFSPEIVEFFKEARR